MPTLAPFSNASSDVFPGGVLELIVQFETTTNSGVACAASGVTIGITQSGAPDSGTGTPVATTSAGITQLGTGLYRYNWDVPASQAPGTYLVTWTGTRASDSTSITYTQAATVAADPESVPLPGLYASVAQYRAWSGDTYTPAQVISVKLQRATEDIDVALVAAVYRTDADGMPLDAQLANVLVRATSAQCAYLLAQNDDTGIKREYSSTSVGGVSATRAASQTGGALPRLAPRALSILRVAGVLPAAPLINWLQGVTMTFTIPTNASPGSPVTYEWLQVYEESQAQAALDATLAQVYPASGLTAHGAAVSNAVTNTALITVPAASILADAVAGSIFYLRAYGIVSAPASAGATLAFNGYSGGSGGTALATMTAFTPTASLAAALFDVEMWVNFYSTTTAQALVKASISSSTSTAAASVFLAGANSGTPVTVTAGTSLTLNAVMGSAVSGSSYEALAAYWNQVA